MTRKILTGVMTVSGTAVIAAIILITWLLNNFYYENTTEELKYIGDIIAQGIELDGKIFLEKNTFGKIRVTWIERDGRVIFDNLLNPDEMENHSDRQEIIDAERSGHGNSERYSRTLTETTINYAAKLSDGSIIRVSMVRDSLIVQLLKLIHPIFAIFAALAFFSIISAVIVSRQIVRPINELDLENTNSKKCYKELSPLIAKLNSQKRRITRQMNEISRKSEQFSLITESMNDGIIISDPKGNILVSNSSAYSLLDADKEKSGSRHSIFSINRSETFRRCIIDAMGGRRSECILSLPSGERQIIASPSAGTNAVNGVAIFILDVTERQQLESMRREFTSNVSHELKTPLTTIHGTADILASGIVKAEDVPAFGNNIRSESERLIKLIEDIVSLSKLDENAVPDNYESIDLFELAAEVSERLKPAAAQKNISCSVSGEHIIVTGNRTVLDEVIYNLCDNAIKYNRDGGKYEVRISHIPTKALITVSDTGIGISKQHIDRIFERFYRADKSRSKKISGTGLGLSIVKHGVMYHNGTVRTESTLGKGSVFIVEIPVEKSEN